MRCDVIIHTAALPHLEVGEKRIHTTDDVTSRKASKIAMC